MKKYLSLAGLFAVLLFFFTSCKEEPPLPTATITATVEGNVVTFTVVATDADKFEWDFGDGSVVSTNQNPTHTYVEYDKDYTVTLTVTGPGGEVTVTHIVTIPPMTKMEMLTGGASVTNGKKWRISASAPVYVALPDATLTIDDTFPAGILTLLGYTTVYTDEYIFFSNNNYTISPKGTGIPAGLVYCTVNSIPNTSPSVTAADIGLTLATPYTPPTGLKFTLNESKNLTVTTTSDGINPVDVTYNNVMTLSFTTGGFIGLMDFMSECIIQELTATTLKIAIFASVVTPPLPLVGKATNVLIFSFEPVP